MHCLHPGEAIYKHRISKMAAYNTKIRKTSTGDCTKVIIMPASSDPIHTGKGDDVTLVQWATNTGRDSFCAYGVCPVIVYVYSGVKRITVGGECHTINKGELFLLPRGQYYMSELIADDGVYHSIAFFFNKTQARKILDHIHADIPIPDSVRTTERGLTVMKVGDEIRSYFETFGEYYNYENSHTTSIISLKLIELVYLLLNTEYADATMEFLIDSSKQDGPDINRTVADNLFRRVTIKELAIISGRSVSRFKREFSQLNGESPHQWINRKRLDHARFLLSTTSKSIDLISEECGYASRPHFARLFKERFGIPPAGYRNSNGKLLLDSADIIKS